MLERGIETERVALAASTQRGRAPRPALDGKWSLPRAVVAVVSDVRGEARKARMLHEAKQVLGIRAPSPAMWAMELRDRVVLVGNAAHSPCLAHDAEAGLRVLNTARQFGVQLPKDLLPAQE
jgi:hypothetical protein